MTLKLSGVLLAHLLTAAVITLYGCLNNLGTQSFFIQTTVFI
ncbi:secreted protein [marine sediment metagenome]|uniref:Secreted protein n=1 Tax=marine sediment metagenome TaxID=412755 RepID=A0A1B6NQP8_9ZZZZ